jgi:hypothetical protein
MKRVLFVDVDDTLYPRSSGLLEEVTKNIQGIYNAYTLTTRQIFLLIDNSFLD